MFVEVESSTSFLGDYLPYVLRQADQTLSAPFYTVLTRYGVARSEWRVLAVLNELGSLSVAELANESLSPQPTVTHAVRRLEERGLIERVTGSADKRQRFVSITTTGAELTAALIIEAKQLEAAAVDQAGDLSDLIEQLKSLTIRIEENIRNQATASQAG